MKEIDFLPKWYKSSKRRQFSYRRQYIALAGMFAVMMVWNFVSLNSVSRATAKLAQMASDQLKAQDVSKEFIRIKNEVIKLQNNALIFDEIDSKIDVASVLAEISFLIGEKIVLSKVEFISERFSDKQQPETNNSSVVRVAAATLNKKSAAGVLLGDVRFKVLINGIAADASDVADLVCKLEDSPYFSQVYPSFSRDKTIQTIGKSEIRNLSSSVAKDSKPVPSTSSGQALSKAGGFEISAEGKLQISEFEISCYLANYCQDKPL